MVATLNRCNLRSRRHLSRAATSCYRCQCHWRLRPWSIALLLKRGARMVATLNRCNLRRGNTLLLVHTCRISCMRWSSYLVPSFHLLPCPQRVTLVPCHCLRLSRLRGGSHRLDSRRVVDGHMHLQVLLVTHVVVPGVLHLLQSAPNENAPVLALRLTPEVGRIVGHHRVDPLALRKAHEETPQENHVLIWLRSHRPTADAPQDARAGGDQAVLSVAVEPMAAVLDGRAGHGVARRGMVPGRRAHRSAIS